MHRIAGWWDGFELWIAGLPFIPQFLVVLVGMVPISFVIALALDRTLREVMRLLGRDRVEAVAVAARVAAPVAPSADATASMSGPPAPSESASRRPARSGAL
ncbi:hypothetical protein [Nocardia arizonensis]|uniref:hypothetical protein n=1 Tax=Nocardia arizonensis TaxID=1141647 RepID=UPI0009E9C964|nr:hypothetical protein [Nocardia arizonensis]